MEERLSAEDLFSLNLSSVNLLLNQTTGRFASIGIEFATHGDQRTMTVLPFERNIQNFLDQLYEHVGVDFESIESRKLAEDKIIQLEISTVDPAITICEYYYMPRQYFWCHLIYHP